MRVNGVGFNGRVKPGPPTGVTFANVGTSRPYNNGAISVSFTAPENQGKYPVSSYTANIVSGSASTATGSSSPLTITNLSSGVNLQSRIYATNVWGDSTNVTSSSILVTTVPQAPTIGSILLTYPTFNMYLVQGNPGGSSVTGFEYSTNGGTNWKALSGITSPQTVSTQSDNSAFVAGVTYAFTLRAINANGASLASAAVNGTYAGTPGLPGSVTAKNTYNVGAISTYTKVTWTAAASNGASITSYTVTASPGGASQTVSSGTLESTFTALTPGTSYTFSVYATNAVGNGSPASSSAIYAVDIGHEVGFVGVSTTGTAYTDVQSMSGSSITNQGACVFLWRGLASGTSISSDVRTRFVRNTLITPSALQTPNTEPQDITDKIPTGGLVSLTSFTSSDIFRIQVSSETATTVTATCTDTAILRYRLGTNSASNGNTATTSNNTGAYVTGSGGTVSPPIPGNYLLISSCEMNINTTIATPSSVRTSLQTFNTFLSSWQTTSSFGEVASVPVVDATNYFPYFHIEKVNFPALGSSVRAAIEFTPGNTSATVSIRNPNITLINLDFAGAHYYAAPADFTTTSTSPVTAGSGAFSFANTGNLHLLMGSAALGGNNTSLSSTAYLEQVGVGTIGSLFTIESNLSAEEYPLNSFKIVEGTSGTFNWKLGAETVSLTASLKNQRIFALDLGIPNAELF
jgi:hypothetical protein